MKHCPTCHRCYDDTQAACTEDNSALVESRPRSPALAGRYWLEVFLGRGNQGTAYEAIEVGNNRPVIAVELLSTEVLDDPQARERFHAAAQAAGRNNGQEVGEVRNRAPLPGGGAYVVMDLIDEDGRPRGCRRRARAGRHSRRRRGAKFGHGRASPSRRGGRVATVRVRLGYVVEDKRGRKRRGEVAQELRLVKAGDRWEISGQRGENMLR